MIIIIHLKISLKINSTKIERERKGKRDLMKLAVINIKTVKTSMHIYAYMYTYNVSIKNCTIRRNVQRQVNFLLIARL